MFNQITVLGRTILLGSLLVKPSRNTTWLPVLLDSPRIFQHERLVKSYRRAMRFIHTPIEVDRSDFIVLYPTADEYCTPYARVLHHTLDTNSIITDIGNIKFERCIVAYKTLYTSGLALHWRSLGKSDFRDTSERYG